MTGNDLKEYIKNVYYLEKSLYEQKALDKSLSEEIKSYYNDHNILNAVNTNKDFLNFKHSPINVFVQDELEKQASYERIKENKKNNNIFYYFESFNFMLLALFSIVITFILAIMKSILDKPFKDISQFFSFALKYSLVIFLVLALIYIIKNLIQYFRDRAKNNEENRKINKYNNEVVKRNNINYERRKIELKNLIREERELKNVTIKSTENILNKLYSINIIFPKYRNLIAISSFYEYFESGRCNTLTGHEGAYNIYESEIRLNHIVDQLDVVIEKLDAIKRNQYMLYDAIRQTQKTNVRIIKEIKTIQNQNIDILKNTSISAYNSSIIAQNTEAIKWYNYFQN